MMGGNYIDTLKSRMNTDLSRRVSRAMDNFGYGAQQRHFRREAYRTLDEINNKKPSPLRHVTVGSKSEGLTNLYESDKDMIVINKFVVCTEQGFEGYASSNQTVMTCIPGVSYQGHMFLQLARFSSNIAPEIRQCFRRVGRNLYMSSADFSDMNTGLVRQSEQNINGLQTHGIVGPSVSTSFGHLDVDFVFVFPCFCPSILHAWASRPRPNNWPSPELIDQVISKKPVVAPTSHAVSVCKQLEWRLCFNLGETLLVSEFKDILSKLYVLLKMVKKDVLKPKNKEVTSYVLKNIVFWLAEMTPQEHFTEETLYDWLVKGLQFLRQAIKQNNLPYYMIPERNLLAGKMCSKQRQEMLHRLDHMLDAGVEGLLMCGKLNRALTLVGPQQLQVLGNLRNELEKLWLTKSKRKVALTNRSLSEEEQKRVWRNDETYHQCMIQCGDIVLPDWRIQYRLGVNVGNIIAERVQLVLV